MENDIYLLVDILLSFRKVYNSAKIRINKALEKYEISLQHAVYLMALDKCKTATVKELNYFTGNDSALTSRSLKKLYKLDMIDKTQKNMKKALIFLTEKGKLVLKNTLDVLGTTKSILTGKLTSNEILTLHKIAKKVN